ncbi:hypothetical protein HMPREF9318_00408 [Streptococcus urinalis FB127-CNA-2]|uniref:Acetyltransferase n=1 Tax=Streptococcus urinalis 2285-97 TaxID=764291 RepID=G5KG00_9STRE|nr:sugar O-acetyltransferase [Streptococcus urinalis]EHJ57272.1 maltose acetyltransferase [Streptococcus urinalis 2285-97]EKS22210.1 hypothetical protein HMPREF9318_00408 [Streptococcus urinalis FB127-CNA-2]VEF32022.1 acetyltransferase [Streptococcus urinalis]
MKTEKEKMLSGELYDCKDPELTEMRRISNQYIYQFNNEPDKMKRQVLIKEWFGKTGENVTVKPYFSCDYGSNIFLGENFYANFNDTFLDVAPIYIGDNVMMGPNCQLVTPIHPLDPKERLSGLEYGLPITIGNNVWLAAGVTILPGVTLGDNVVVGAGSVVTKSYKDNVVIAGNPAKIIKEIK